MRPLIREINIAENPRAFAARLPKKKGLIALASALLGVSSGRYSFIAAEPFLIFRSRGRQCELWETGAAAPRVQPGDPWRLLDDLIRRYQADDEFDSPFPLGGCLGFWGYENFSEPSLPSKHRAGLDLPDCHVGFYDSLVVFDEQLGKTFVISTGLGLDGARDPGRAEARLERWLSRLSNGAEEEAAAGSNDTSSSAARLSIDSPGPESFSFAGLKRCDGGPPGTFSTWTRDEFLEAVRHAQRYIRQGDIYQVNLSHRISALARGTGWDFFERLTAVSPAPFSAYLHGGDFEIASSSPELFLRMNGSRILTRPIKGTRPRSADPSQDARWRHELRTSPKEAAELVMITDLLRNDLGKICAFGSVTTPELVRLERFAQVQHLVSTVEGTLRPEVSHVAALASCFPGGSITGAPKIRAMQIIDELEPAARGAYTGSLGYIGFNRKSQLSLLIRAGVVRGGAVHFQVGAGIVADSIPEAEWSETLAKAGGFFEAL